MPSSRNRTRRRASQRGFGLVEVLVATGLLAVAVVVMLGSLSSLLVGARTAERQTVEERLARNQIEQILAQPFQCPAPAVTTTSPAIDRMVYTIRAQPQSGDCDEGFLEWVVTVSDRSGAKLSLTVDQAPR